MTKHMHKELTDKNVKFNPDYGGDVLRYLLGRWYKVIKALFGLGNSMQILLS